MNTILMNTVLTVALLLPGLAAAQATQPAVAPSCCGTSCCAGDAKPGGPCCGADSAETCGGVCASCCKHVVKRPVVRPTPTHPKGTHSAF